MEDKYELKYVEGNKYELISYGTVIATIYTTKDTYAFDIDQLVNNYNKNKTQ